MKFAPHLLDEIRARLPVSAVVGRKVALKKKGREFAGLSPFKTEKTPSFFVNDQKGFYHCFASGEHGDIFTFLMKTEGLSFPEAVERLADEAGVTLPKPEPRERERQEQRLRLHEVQEAAARLFETHLRSQAGAHAREYLNRRGLSEETIRTFRIGYAPSGRTDLLSRLKQDGFSDAEIAQSGLVISGPDIARPYDRFRNRVMFPITDLRGKVIAFGGRALDADQPAKYLNSPETPIFHKGHVLFNAAQARQVAHESGELVVVEGYMDVIALAQAGMRCTVAPLGTALTADQVRLLWRFADVPLLCFDGDGAGRKAAYRALDTTLPMLAPGHSLKFAFLPDGLDPDDFVKTHGINALTKLFQSATTFSDALWDRAWSEGQWETPERRALLEKRLRDETGLIEEPSVRSHYQQLMRERAFQAWRAMSRDRHRTSNTPAPASSAGGVRRTPPGGPASARSARNGGRSNGSRSMQPGSSGVRFGGIGPDAAPTSAAIRRSAVVVRPDNVARKLEIMIVSALVAQPDLIETFAEDLAGTDFADSRCESAISRLLALTLEAEPLDTYAVKTHVEGLGIAFPPQTSGAGEIGEGWGGQDDPHGDGLRRLLGRHRAISLQKDLDQALADFTESGSDADGDRVIEIKRLLTQLELNEAAPVETFTP